MALPVVNRTTLSGALAKINYLRPGEQADFTEEELAALYAFTDGTMGQDLECSRRREFVARVNAIVANFPRPQVQELSDERRRNMLLRAALNQLQDGGPITESERNLIMGTLAHLKESKDLDVEEKRLQDILESSMGMTPTVEEVEPPDGDGTVFQDVGALFASAEQEFVEDLDGIPLGKNVLVRRISGPVELHDALPEGHLLRVERGSVRVKGNVSGIVWADGDIGVQGDLLGGMAVSDHGDISARRAAAAAFVTARRGGVALAQAENAQGLFAAEECRIEGDLFTSTLTAHAADIGGQVRDSLCQIVDRFSAGDMAESSKGQNRIVFRRLLLPADYRVPDEDDALNLLRTALRAQFRIETGEAWVNALHRERSTAQATILYALRAGLQASPAPQALRNAHILHIYLGLLIRIAEEGQRYLLRAADAPQEVLKLFFTTAADDLQNAARVFEKEIELVPEELARTAKPAILQAGRHLTNGLKKAKEAVGQGKPADGPFESLSKRLAEWRTQLAAAEESLESLQGEADRVLGPAAKASPEQMERLLNATLAEAGAKATSGLMRMMRSGLERIGPATEKWEGSATAAHLEFLSSHDRLQKDFAIHLAHGAAPGEATASVWGTGVAIHPLRPRDPAVSNWGIAETAPNTPGGTIFRQTGLAVVPVGTVPEEGRAQ